MNAVYHYTDTGRLPWILQDGVLRPGRNTLGGFPDPDFLWATTIPIPDGTASSGGTAALAALRRGDTRAVRFTLRADDFLPWPDIVKDFPAWTPAEVKRLERAARGRSSPSSWRCRAEPLPASHWISVETRGWADSTWSPVDPDAELIDLGDEALGLWLGELAYFSGKTPQPSGQVGYAVFTGRRKAA